MDTTETYSVIIRAFLPYIYLLIGISLLGVVVRMVVKLLKPKVKGSTGEASVALLLRSLPAKKYILLKDIMLQTDRGSTQIDHILVSVYGIFVIEVKNYSGWIYGSEKGKTWTQSVHGQKHSFMNPLHQNYKHVKALQDLFPELPVEEFISIVTFPGDTTLKFRIPNVVKWGVLTKSIKAHSTIYHKESDIVALADRILAANINSTQAKKVHVQAIKDRKGR